VPNREFQERCSARSARIPFAKENACARSIYSSHAKP